MTIRVRYVPRERDEELLDWIRLHEEGVSYGEIARRYGVCNSGIVSTAIKNVLEATE